MTNTYNRAGRLLQHSVYPGSCGSDEIREEYTYGEDGSRGATTQEIRGKNSPAPPPPIATATEKESGPLREVLRYDSAGALIETSTVRASGKIVYRISYAYDTNHRLIETTSFGGDGTVSSRRVYVCESDKKAPSSFTYYGGDGRIYERTVYSEYEFDSHGNWIKRKEYREQTYNRRDTSLAVRNIEYH